MAVETGQAGETADDPDADPDRNDVTVEFADGTAAAYAVVVRPPAGDWLHAERLVGDGDGLDDEEIEAINPDAVQRIRSDCVHVFDGGAVHYGEGLLVDPDALLADCGLA
jgi:hypothetical protein